MTSNPRYFLRAVHWWLAAQSAVLLSSLLIAALPNTAFSQEAPSQFRSVTDVRPRIPDEHDRPYFRETQSHRGFEIRDEHFTIIATTSREDSRWAAAQVSQAWQNAAALVDRWTAVHHNPDFGLQAIQVVVDDHPLRDRDAPLTTVNVTGIQTQIQINVAPGQPPLAQQLLRLREATAFAVLHSAGLDSAAPPWAVAGVAAFAGRRGLSAEQLKQADASKSVAEFGGQQWRFQRSAEDVLDYRRVDHDQATQQVAFLLTGDDAEHAPAFLASLQQATTGSQQAAAEGEGFKAFPGDPRLASGTTALDQLAGQLGTQFEGWKKNPLAGQPVLEPAASDPPELVAAEREMALLLKLQRRFSAPAKEQYTRTKIVTFDRQKGAVTEPAQQPAATTVSFAALASRLTNPEQPVWATLDIDGSLLLSTDRRRIDELLGNVQAQYSLEQQEGRTVLVRHLDTFRTARGWLADNPDDKSRPLAKFEVVDSRAKAKPAAGDKKEQQAANLPR